MLTTMLSVANDLLKLRLFLVVARRYDECHHVGGCEVIGDHIVRYLGGIQLKRFQ